MKTKNPKTLKVIAVLLVGIFALVTSSCTTRIPSETHLYSGVSSAQASYNPSEAGRHWVRPQEITYRPLDIVDYTIEVYLSDISIQEAVIFGYPQAGQAASPYVIQAISEAIIESGADGFLLSTYTIESVGSNGKDTAIVSIHGRPLKLVNLGEVKQERADQERFVTRIVVEEDRERGIIKTTTTTTPIAIEGSQGLISLSKGTISRSNSAVEVSTRQEKSTLRKVLLWTGGIVGSALLISAVASASSV